MRDHLSGLLTRFTPKQRHRPSPEPLAVHDQLSERMSLLVLTYSPSAHQVLESVAQQEG
jgi:hypothetical protein